MKTNITSNTTSIKDIQKEIEIITDRIDIRDTVIKIDRVALKLLGIEINCIQSGLEIHDQKLFTFKCDEGYIIKRFEPYSLTTHTHKLKDLLENLPKSRIEGL